MKVTELYTLMKPLIRRDVTALGAGEFAPTPHDLGSIHHSGSISDSQAPQFLKTDGTRDLTGNLTVSPTITVDGVDISLFKSAYDAHILNPDAHHLGFIGLKDDSNVIAAPDASDYIKLVGGLGLTSTSGTSLVTLAMGTPGGLSVSTTNEATADSHTHAITASYQPGVNTQILKTSTGGELYLAGDFGVDTDTLYVDVSEDIVTVNAGGAAPTYRGALTVRPATNSQKGFVLQGQSGQQDIAPLWQILDSSGNDLIILTNLGDLESGNPGFVSGLTGWQVSHEGNAEFWNAYIRGELHASVFVADEMHATGGTIAVMTTAKVAPPVGVNDNVMGALDAQFVLNVQASWDTGLSYLSYNNVARLKFMSMVSGGSLDLYDVYVEVDSVGSIVGRDLANGEAGYFPVTVTRRSGGATNLIIPAGTGMVKWGVVGGATDSFTGGILLTSDLNYSPYIDVFTVNSDGSPAPWEATAVIPRVRVGNLDGVLGLAEQWGIAFGTNLSDTSQPYGVFSDLQAALVGITQTWWDSAQNAVAQMVPTAIGSESLFWLGPSASNKKLDYLASGILALKSGVYIGNAASGTPLLNGGLLWLPFDSGAGSTTYTIDTRNLVDWSEPTTVAASVIAVSEGKYHKGAALGEARTNYIENPVFSVNITDGYGAASGTGTVTWNDVQNYLVGGCLRILAGTTSTYITTDYPAGANTGLAVPDGSTVFLQARVRMNNASGTASITIRDITTPASVATSNSPAVANVWSLVVASWTNNTGVTKYVQARLVNSTNDSATYAYFDAVQLELTRITPFFYGGMNSDYTWSSVSPFTGVAHQSPSIRGSSGYIKYPLSWSAAWTISCWVYPYLLPTETGEYTRIFEWVFDTNNRVYVYYDYVNEVVRANWTGNSTQTVTSVTSVSLSRDVSTHVALTYDGTTMSLYIGGTLIDAKTGMTTFSTNPDYMFVGCNVALGTFLDGVIDDFVVVDSCVPAETITKINASASSLIIVNSTELHMFTAGDGRIRINPDGLYLSDSLGRGVLGAASSPPGSSWGGFTLSEGDIVIGDNRAGRAAIFWDNSAGTFGFYGNAGTPGSPEVYINTDGTLKAGGGEVTLSQSGISINIPTAVYEENNITWKSGATQYFWIGGYSSAGQTYGIIEVPSVSSNYQHFLNLLCSSPATYPSVITLEAQSGAATKTQFYISNDSNASPVGYFLFKGGDVQIDEGIVLGVTSANPPAGTFVLDNYIGFLAEISDPAAPSADGARLYIKDNGSGKTQLCVRFNTGVVQVIATQP